jgi:hypothetical protein
MNVSKITIARLYNLGDYEHVRYELTIEVPAGESPATALIGAENILAGLNPKKPAQVPGHDAIQRHIQRIAEIEKMTDDQIAKSYNKDRVVVLHEARQALVLAENRLAAWESHQAHARKLLEDLGGAANWVDAKRDWGFNDDEF